MSLADKMSLWQDNEGKEPEAAVPDSSWDCDIEDDLDHNSESDLLDVSSYRNALTQSSAYPWLLSHLQLESNLECAGPVQTKNVIKHQILDKIGRPAKISRKYQSSVCTIMFDLCSPIVLWEQQQYKETLSEVISDAITVTGHGDNVQATTCLQYMSQTWPQTGENIIRLLQRCVETGVMQSCQYFPFCI
jgi:hypothetical protein